MLTRCLQSVFEDYHNSENETVSADHLRRVLAEVFAKERRFQEGQMVRNDDITLRQEEWLKNCDKPVWIYLFFACVNGHLSDILLLVPPRPMQPNASYV
jgi:hypothetical protein